MSSAIPDEGGAEIFRREAVEHYQHRPQDGDVLRISPQWTRWTYWVLLAVFVTLLIASLCLRVSEYASGPTVVRVDGRTDVTATAAGTVVSVYVQPGQRVADGQLLVKFYNAQEATELDRIEHEFDLQLLKVMLDPSDQIARQALTGLRTQKELAAARLDERNVRAPHDAVISDLRIRPGQLINPGELVLSLVTDDAAFYVTALLPGQYRPMLHPGTPMRLEIAGFEYCYQDVVIESVGDGVVGPTEVRRFLGQELADAVQLDGPVVLVHARLPGRSLVCENQTFNYFNGMNGVAYARVREEPVLVTFVPALRYLFGGGT